MIIDYLKEYLEQYDVKRYKRIGDLKIPVTAVNGTFYHGSSVESGEDPFEVFEFGYSDWDAIWITPDKYVAEEFCSWQGDKGRDFYLYTVNFSSKNMALIDMSVFKDLQECFGFDDLREYISFLSQHGFDGWVTQGSIGRTIYDDIAVFDTDLLKILSYKKM